MVNEARDDATLSKPQFEMICLWQLERVELLLRPTGEIELLSTYILKKANHKFARQLVKL